MVNIIAGICNSSTWLITPLSTRNNPSKETDKTIRVQYGDTYRVFETIVLRAISAAEAL